MLATFNAHLNCYFAITGMALKAVPYVCTVPTSLV